MSRSDARAMRPDTARVLLVEDDRVYQRIARELLEEVGLEVTVTDDGARALEAVRHADYDLILMDLEMPVMDGYHASEAIRQLPGRATLPIIAMTAHILPSDRERCTRAGMNGHVAKPIDPDIFYRTLAHCLSVTERPPAPNPPPSPPLAPRLELTTELANGGRESTVEGGGFDSISNATLEGASAESLIGRLERMLRDATPRAMELLPWLERALGERHREPLRELRRRLGEFEFEASLAIVGRLREALKGEGGKGTERRGITGVGHSNGVNDERV